MFLFYPSLLVLSSSCYPSFLIFTSSCLARLVFLSFCLCSRLFSFHSLFLISVSFFLQIFYFSLSLFRPPLSLHYYHFLNFFAPFHLTSSSLSPFLPLPPSRCTAIRADSAYRRQRGIPEDPSPRPAARATPSDTPASTPQLSPRIRRFSSGHGGAYVTETTLLYYLCCLVVFMLF